MTEIPTTITLWFFHAMICFGSIQQPHCSLDVHDAPFDTKAACIIYREEYRASSNLAAMTVAVCSEWSVPVSTE